MDTAQSLFEEIRFKRFDPADLHLLLIQRFKGAMQPCPHEVVYPGDPANYSIKLCLSEVGDVKDVLVGPKLTANERNALQEQIVSEILTSSGLRVASLVLFSDLPVQGWYRQGTLLQILPPPKEAPRSEHFLAEHPFVLQFSFPSSPSWVVRNSRKANRGRQIGLMLTGLLAGTVWPQSGNGEHHWVLRPQKRGGVRSEYLQAGYVCSGLSEESDAFDSTDKLEPLPEIDPSVYYFRWGLVGESRFEVPRNLSELVDGFCALPPTQQDQFIRACYWLEWAGKTYVASRSAAFAALVTSIEAVMGPESGGPACKTCGKPTGKSVRQRFRDLLEELAPGGAGIETARKELYSVRSTLLHGSRLLPSDYLGIRPGPGLSDEFHNMHHAQCLVRLVLAKWLAKKAALVSAGSQP